MKNADLSIDFKKTEYDEGYEAIVTFSGNVLYNLIETIIDDRPEGLYIGDGEFDSAQAWAYGDYLGELFSISADKDGVQTLTVYFVPELDVDFEGEDKDQPCFWLTPLAAIKNIIKLTQ